MNVQLSRLQMPVSFVGEDLLELSAAHQVELAANIRRGWQAKSACASAADDRWYPDRTDTQLRGAAVARCAICPVRRSCLAFALSHGEQHGVWGGTTDIQRTALRIDLSQGVSVADVLDSATIRPAYLWRRAG